MSDEKNIAGESFGEQIPDHKEEFLNENITQQEIITKSETQNYKTETTNMETHAHELEPPKGFLLR